MGERKKVPARFYRSASGAEPVPQWLLDLGRRTWTSPGNVNEKWNDEF